MKCWWEAWGPGPLPPPLNPALFWRINQHLAMLRLLLQVGHQTCMKHFRLLAKTAQMIWVNELFSSAIRHGIFQLQRHFSVKTYACYIINIHTIDIV